MPVICPDCKSENTDDSRFCKACGTSMEPTASPSSLTNTLVSPQAPPEGEKLVAGRYKILSTLGRGGMGDVYRVHDIKLHEEMALKLLRPEIARDPDTIQRFRNELKLARKITHRNVCRVFDFHEEEGTPFITMEYVEGEDLKSLIKRKGRLQESEAIGIAIQIAEGLVEAHGLGVVHRDLKPQNIMIDPGGQAKVMDFGIARSLQASGLTQTGQMLGTPDYISSEQAAGEPADHRADIYALGIILYEMSTGRLPFEGDTALSVITKHREKAARDPREINQAITEGLSRLILRCMEKDRARRYQSAPELLEDLRDLSEGKVPKASRGVTRGDLFRSRKWIGLAGAAALILIAAAIAVWRIQGRSPSPASEPERPSLAVVYFENNTGDKNLAYWRKAFAELLTADLSQSKYMKVLPGDQIYKILDDLGQLDAAAYSSDILKQVAQKGRVRHILRGSYIKAGPRFRVSVSLQDMETGEVVGSQTAEAEDEENLFALVDDLTKQIKSDMHLTSKQLESDFDREAAEVTTFSPEAYKFFVEGLRHHYRAEYQLCIESMDRAIAIDPEFASAYGWKAWAYDSAGYHTEFVVAMTKAFELRNRVSERERFRFTAFYYMRVANDIPKAFDELRKFVSLYPEDMYANHQLGYLYFHAMEDFEKSVEYLKHNVENRVEIFYSYYLMAWAEMCLGSYDKARDVCELYIIEIGDHPEIRFNLSINDFCRGEYDRALTEAQKAAELGFSEAFWNDLIKGAILQAIGNIAEAERHYRNMVDSRDVLVGVMGRESLGQLALQQGRFEEARSQIEQAINLVEAAKDEANMSRLYSHLAYICLRSGDHEAALKASGRALEYSDKSMDAFGAVKLAIHLKGLSQLAMGDSGGALKTAEELKALAERDPNPRGMKHYLHLVGSIETEEGNFSSAIKSFEEAASLLPAQNQDDLAGLKDSLRRTIYLASLAEVHFRAGNMDNARQAYEALTALSIGRHHWADLYVKAFYRLGQISEKQAKPDEAAVHYRKFLDLWKDADPGLTEVDEARTRLAGLR
jgi:serine/threonine protein kinase